MKKGLSILVLICVLASCFSGCNLKGGKLSDEEVAKLINSAFENTAELTAVNMSTKNKVAYTFPTYSLSTVTSNEIREKNIGDEDKFEMSTETTVNVDGNESAYYEAYYKNGYYYTDRYMGKFKVKISPSKLQNDTTDILTEVSLEDMRTVDVRTNATHSPVISEDAKKTEGCTVITFTCKNKALREHLITATEDEAFGDDMKVTSGKGKYVIDENGYLIYGSLTVSSTVNNDGSEGKVSVTTQAEYAKVGKKVNPYDPEDKEYAELDSLDNVAELNEAMSAALTDSELNIKMEGSTDIEQDGAKFGYKRNYVRKLSTEKEGFLQETKTDFYEDGKLGKTAQSAQYFTDGTYYINSNDYMLKHKSDMEFGQFVSRIYTADTTTPADILSPAIMKSVKVQNKGDTKIFTFELNPKSKGGERFILSLFGPYDNFGGDVSSAEIDVKAFTGKAYLQNGKYIKTEFDCDIDIKFEEGKLKLKAEQTVEIKPRSKAGDMKFPKLKGYESMPASEIFDAYSGNVSLEEN